MNRKGFTLIEAMILLAILGILAAIAVPNFQAMRAAQRAKQGKAPIAKTIKEQAKPAGEERSLGR